LDLSNSLVQKIGEFSPAIVPFVIIAAGVVGSIHCIGMCGALALTAGAQSKKGLVAYHIGRFLGYFGIGALAGFLGAGFIHSEMKYISLFSSILLGLSFFAVGLSIIKKGQPHIRQPAILKVFYQKKIGRILESKTSPIISGCLIGMLSPLLPCGWLYGFILIAVTANNAFWGGILLASFWIGTLPALSGISLLAHRPMRYFNNKGKVILGIFFIFAGISSVLYKLTCIGSPSCH